MPTGHTVHRTLEVDGDRLRCAACGWVRAARKAGKPYCSVAKRQYHGPTQRQRHRRKRGSVCELCGAIDDLQADHDHACHPGPLGCLRCFRGTLCGTCNRRAATIERMAASGILWKMLDYLNERSLVPLDSREPGL